MTAIAALIDKGQVWIGGDSAGVSGMSLTIRKDEKVFHNGKFLIGGTTSFRMLSLLRYSFKPPVKKNNISDLVYMNTVFIDDLRECFKAGGFSDGTKGGTFFVGFNKALYMIDSDLQVGLPRDPFSACGCGEDLCVGSLYSTKGRPPKERIKLALQAAERFSAGVRGPFIIKSI